jgi:hypothetical protein
MTDEVRMVKVWAATTIPGAHPLSGVEESGYGVAWVDQEDGTRLQVMVEELPVPAPDSTGRLRRRTIGGEDMLFYISQENEI